MPAFSTFTPSRRVVSESASLLIAGRYGIEWATFAGSLKGERWNEDALLIAGSVDVLLLAVFDGVTPIPWGSQPNGGHLASASATRGVLAAFMEGEHDPARLLLAGNAAIRATSAEFGITPGDPLESISTTAVIVVLDIALGELNYATISDSSLVIEPRNGEIAKLNATLLRRATTNEIYKAAETGSPAPTIDDAFWERVRDSRRGQNSATGRGNGVLNGMTDDLLLPYIDAAPAPVALDTVNRLFLFTDGAELNQLGQADSAVRAAAGMAESGALAYLEHVRALEESDPDRATYPRIKMHDDSTAIMLTIQR